MLTAGVCMCVCMLCSVGVSVCMMTIVFSFGYSAAVLFVVSKNEANIFDQKRIEFKLWEE